MDDAIQELKETVFKDLFAEELTAKAKLVVQDCIIETDLEILIPDTYINNTSERLQLYSSLDNIKNEEELQKFTSSLVDRFGILPMAVEQLINTVRLRWMGEELGFEKISLKNDKLRGYFVSGKDDYFKSDVFGRILAFVQTHPKKCRVKETGGKPILTVEDITNVEAAIEVLSPITTRYNANSRKETLSA